MALGASFVRRVRTLPKMHLGCLVLILLELAVGAILHQPSERLWKQWERGSVQERIDALLRLAHRGEGIGIDRNLMLALSRQSDERLRAMGMTAALAKHGFGSVQVRQLRKLRSSDPAAWCRSSLILGRRVRAAGHLSIAVGPLVESGGAMSREELEWFVNSLRGETGICPLLKSGAAAGEATSQDRRRDSRDEIGN